jgi:hypothetical protein
MGSSRHSRQFLFFVLLLAPLFVGCQGCRQDDDIAKSKKEARVPADTITAGAPRTIPRDPNTIWDFAKPGHWTSVSQTWQANGADLRGELRFGLQPNVAKGQAPLPPFALTSERPAALPKGTQKSLDTRLLIPFGNSNEKEPIQLRGSFIGRDQSFEEGISLPKLMASHEYFFVVLSNRPEQLTTLRVHDWVNPPQGVFEEAGQSNHDYRIVFPVAEGNVYLPDTFFEWTSIAYLLWDDVAPEQLTLDQRQAIRDWLHWGGRIIVNGPAAASLLEQNAEFADLLPLHTIRGEGISSDLLISLVDQWSVPSDRSIGTVKGMLDDDSDRVGVVGQAAENSYAVPQSHELMVNRPVGLGNICMSRFDLTASWLVKWDSVQSLYNNVFMQRPPRHYSDHNGSLLLGFNDFPEAKTKDAGIATRLRIFARDANITRNREQDVTPTAPAMPSNSWLDFRAQYVPGTGIGAWSDHSDAAELALGQLREQAGISIPDIRFVSKSLLIYLLIVVPLNYLVFRLLGHVEWAWIAVPIIGLVGAAWIAREAQLDIGFARSQTEFNVLEIQPPYARGHLSRFVGIYNSLSTTYDFRFLSRDSVAAPVGVLDLNSKAAAATFRHSFEPSQVSLYGINVPSNQTTAIHAEQMIDLAGTVRWIPDAESDRRGEIENGTKFTMLDSIVVSRDIDGNVRFDAVGSLEAGRKAQVRFADGPGRVASELPMGADIVMGPLARGDDLGAGEIRFIARLEEPIAGFEVHPTVSQIQQQTVVIAHLATIPLPLPQVDRNLRMDIKVVDSFSETVE